MVGSSKGEADKVYVIGSFRWGIAAWILFAAFCLSVPIVHLSGLIPNWGKWYSSELQVRHQTDALLDGDIGLRTAPGFEELNYLWDNGRVQQVWGLGVAAWRLPFETAAAWTGRSGFPDRIAFGLALIAVSALAIRTLSVPPSGRDLRAVGEGIRRSPERLVAVMLLILFPPFLALLFSRFSVYEEVQAYAYLAGIGLLLATLSFWRKPAWATFFVVAFLAGAVPLVRPTLGVYGVVSFALIAYRACSLPRWRLGMAIGTLCFLSGGATVMAFNVHRFGSAFEFGHSLNLNPDASMRYVSRFDNPYREEPVVTAASELGTWLFMMTPGEYEESYGRRFDPASREFREEGLFRYRRLNSLTYDPTYLISLTSMAAWLMYGFLIRKLRRREKFASEASILAVWSLLAFVPLFCFYLWFPVLYARYLLDFAPALAAAAAGFVLLCGMTCFSGMQRYFRWLMIVLVLAWWGYQLDSVARGDLVQRDSVNPPVTYGEMRELMEEAASEYQPVPEFYETGMNVGEYGNRYNGSGWNADSGNTGAAVALFVEDPEFLELTVAPVEGATLSQEEYEIIRAKVALEFLELESMTPTTDGTVIRFSGPKRKRYQTGIQVVFIAFVTAEELQERWSRFRLLRVEWKEL